MESSNQLGPLHLQLHFQARILTTYMMHSQTFLLAAAAAIFSPASAAPLQKKDTVLPNGDLDILNYALTLEFLERKFYEEGVKNYSEWDFKLNGMDGSFYKNLNGILFDEQVSASLSSLSPHQN